MSTRYKKEKGPNLSFLITKKMVREGVPQSKSMCTLAQGARGVGLEDVSFSYDLEDDCVRAAWTVPEVDKDPRSLTTGKIRERRHFAVVHPERRARQILIATDTDLTRLSRLIPDEGWKIELADHTSCWKQFNKGGRQGGPTRGPDKRPRKRPRTSLRMRGFDPDKD